MNPESAPTLLDVTLRDGGYVNGHSWTLREAEAVVRAVGACGVPYLEVGYLRDAHDPRRPTASCPPAHLDALAAVDGRPALAVMVRPGEVPVARIAQLPDHGVSMVRVLVGGASADQARPYVAKARETGLAVATNLTRVSERDEAGIAAAVRACAAEGAEVVYLADSNGSLDPDGVAARVTAARDAAGLPVGFHPHDNLGLAFINAKAALAAGATALDASIAGIGKGGGNLRLEVVVAHLIVRHGADLRLDPIADGATTLAARLRMLADGSTRAVLTGLLNLNLDSATEFDDLVAANGYDATISALSGQRRTPARPVETGSGD